MKSILLSLLLMVGAVGAWGQKRDVEMSAEEREAMSAYGVRVGNESDGYFEDGDYRLVIELLRMTNAMYPDDYETVSNLGWMYGNIEDKASELDVYVKYMKLRPKDPEAYYPAGEFYFKEKKYAEAVAILEKALLLPGERHANTYRVLAGSYKRLEKLEDAARVYRLLVKKDPDDLAAKKNLSDVLKVLGKGGG